MAKNRYVSTRMWRDEYFSKLNNKEKLIFVYCLTCPDTNLCGIYEIPLYIIAIDTDIPVNEVEIILKKFEHDNRIKYQNGWVAIKNFMKYQKFNPSTQIAADKEFELIPEYLKKWTACLQPVDSMATDVIKLNKSKSKNKSMDKSKNKKMVPVFETVMYLNQVAGKSYKADSAKSIRCITARVNEGYTLDNFKTVIDRKTKQWIHSDMEQYLRPETLFGPKFEGYINESDKQHLGKSERVLLKMQKEAKHENGL